MGSVDLINELEGASLKGGASFPRASERLCGLFVSVHTAFALQQRVESSTYAKAFPQLDSDRRPPEAEGSSSIEKYPLW